ncbi:MAG: hypothetical protein WD490_05960 [Opitutales bacterium]
MRFPRKAFSPWVQASFLTAGTLGLFFFIRFLPGAVAPELPAAFLAAASGSEHDAEFCDISELGFTVVSEGRSPFRMGVSPSVVEKGEEVDVLVSLRVGGGRPITPEDLDVTHTERIHLLIIDSSLEDYHHKHPQPTSVPGEFRFSFTPRRSGGYRVFADVVPSRTGRPAHAVATLRVNGGDALPQENAEPAPESDYTYELVNPLGEYRVHQPAQVFLRARHRHPGMEVRLEPIMGAYAHLVGFDENSSGFIHMHPIVEKAEKDLDPLHPELSFLFHVTEPGSYKIWAQLKIDDEERFVPFEVYVKERER